MTIDLPDLGATARLGQRIAAELRAGDVVALRGTLGAGKTTLARSIIAALGYAGEIPSPTFAIFEVYEVPAVRLPVVHADFYRLDRPEEVLELGLDDYRRDAALIAEWPEKAGDFAGPEVLDITLQNLGENAGETGRLAIVRAGQSWQKRGPWT